MPRLCVYILGHSLLMTIDGYLRKNRIQPPHAKRTLCLRYHGAGIESGDPADFFQFSFKFEPSQCDKKLFLDLSGAGGGYCLHCNTTMEDAQNQDLIVEGFPMDRNIKDLNERFQALDSKGLIDARKKGDYSQRTGLTHEPIWKELDPTKYIPVLHAWINALKLFERFCYLQNSRKSFPNEWPKTGPGIRLSKEAKLAQDTAKKVFSAQAKATMKLTLNMADIGGTSGNSDTGNNAREFFSAKNREKVLDLYDFHGNDRDSLRDLLQRWNVVLRVQSSIELIDVPDFVDYCKETYLKTKDLFPWHTIPGAMHAVLAHSPQQIQSNGGYGLGQKSESPLESLHYFMRIFEKYQSRKISTEACLYDTMKRLYLKSCQLVRSQRLEKKPAQHEISFLSQDDKLVQSFFIYVKLLKICMDTDKNWTFIPHKSRSDLKIQNYWSQFIVYT